jgi:flavin reductase (DIM6/NTAB) family NADH-FMN oxidoreductase RutF
MTAPDSLGATFTEVMAGVPTPVSVVTAMDGDRPHGTTVSAFASLSLVPPMLLVSLDRQSDLLKLLRAKGRFGVNVLASDQAAVAKAFAVKGATKFDGINWRPAEGLPRLDGAAGWLACSVADLVDGGDHVIALGTVLTAEAAGRTPMTYHARSFGTHAAHDGVAT